MELLAQDLYFFGNSTKEQAYDCCTHGKIIFKVDDHLLSDNSEWCVSASAYRFLHSLFENHTTETEDFLIPCCGHTLIPSEDKTSVDIIGCPNGIDFNITHEQGRVTIGTVDNVVYDVPFSDYKDAVLSFAKQVMDFYNSNPPREFADEFAKEGFSAFVTEWYSLYERATALIDSTCEASKITFADYDTYTENEILGMNKNGISLSSFRFIHFKECAYHFQQMNGGLGNCVGERDITGLSFTFYTAPKPIRIQLIERNKLIEIFSKTNTISRFHKLQSTILKYGYNTRDCS